MVMAPNGDNNWIYQRLDKQDEKLAVIPVMNEKLNNLAESFKDFKKSLRWNVAQLIAILGVGAAVVGTWIGR